MIFHRGELHALLAKAVPPERIHLAHRCVGFDQDAQGVRIQFENGSSASADILIGADGIHSTVRRVLLGLERPRFACRAYRGLIPAEKVPDIPRESSAWLGPGRHLVHYFVSAGRMLNFVGHVEQEAWLSESWTEPGKVEDLRAAYAGWHPQVQRIIDAVDETFIWAVIDRPPIARWTFGRVTMLGDASHPMIPFMGQGGAQAIEDAAAITACLVRCGDDVDAALKLYETVRLPRASAVQTGSWNNKARYHMVDGPAQVERDALIAKGMTDWAYRAVAWVYGHDAGILDGNPGLPEPAGH
jgi:salicylate hydroxylase